MRRDLTFIAKTSVLFCALSAAFSFVGIFLAQKGPLGNPLPAFTIEEIGGHFLWGLAAGALTLSLRYTLVAGAFAVLIDSDHLIGLTPLEAIPRMSHSILFGVVALVVLVLLFGKKDWRLGAVAFAAVLSHISFDIFAGDPWFPFLTPFYNNQLTFTSIDWLYFEVAAVTIVGVAAIIARKKELKKLAA